MKGYGSTLEKTRWWHGRQHLFSSRVCWGKMKMVGTSSGMLGTLRWTRILQVLGSIRKDVEGCQMYKEGCQGMLEGVWNGNCLFDFSNMRCWRTTRTLRRMQTDIKVTRKGIRQGAPKNVKEFFFNSNNKGWQGTTRALGSMLARMSRALKSMLKNNGGTKKDFKGTKKDVEGCQKWHWMH